MQNDRYFYTYDSDGYLQTKSPITTGSTPIVDDGVLFFESEESLDMEDTMIDIESPDYDISSPNSMPVKPLVVVLTQEEVRSKFTRERDAAVASSTVEFEGMVFDSDEVSQNRMLRPIAVLENDTDTQLWVLHDNSVVSLTRPQFIAVLSLAGQQQTSMWVQP